MQPKLAILGFTIGNLICAGPIAMAQTEPAVLRQLREIAAKQQAAIDRIGAYSVDFDESRHIKFVIPSGTPAESVPSFVRNHPEDIYEARGTRWGKGDLVRTKRNETANMPGEEGRRDVETVVNPKYRAEYTNTGSINNIIRVFMPRVVPQGIGQVKDGGNPLGCGYKLGSRTLEELIDATSGSGKWTIDHVEDGGRMLLRLDYRKGANDAPTGHRTTLWVDPDRNYLICRYESQANDGGSSAFQECSFQALPDGTWFPETFKVRDMEDSMASVEYRCTFSNPRIKLDLSDDFFTYDAFELHRISLRMQVHYPGAASESYRWSPKENQWILTKTSPASAPIP